MLNSLSILIPAFRDEDTISKVVKEADKVGSKVAKKHEIIVINDASPDKLEEVLVRLKSQYKNLKVITHKENKGYGQTIKELYYLAINEWFFTVPGDNQIPPGELEKLEEHSQEADMIIGWRVSRHDSESRLFQSAIYNGLLRILFGVGIHDINSVRLAKTTILKAVNLRMTSAFVDAELTISTMRKGFRVIEVPINHQARYGTGAGGGSLKTILPTIAELFKYWLIKM